MVSLRHFTTIQTNKEVAAAKDYRYTLIAGETKKNYCKIMINVRTFNTNGVSLDYIKELIMKYGKKRVDQRFKSGHIRPERRELKEEEANSLIGELINLGYLKYTGLTAKRDKLHPNIPEGGIKYYIFDKFKIIECEQSKYFQQKQHRVTERAETKGTLSERKCRALRQLYAHFEDKTPFTYGMVMDLPKYYKQLSENQSTPEESKIYYRVAAQNLESRSVDFLDTWNSLIRNNFLIPYKIKTKDGIIKIRQGAYKVNMVYVRRCLSATNL